MRGKGSPKEVRRGLGAGGVGRQRWFGRGWEGLGAAAQKHGRRRPNGLDRGR